MPILKKFGDDTPTSSRADVFAFIESEVKEIAPYLPRDKSTTTYGRPTAWMAHALLAKMYLNAQVYAGKTMLSASHNATLLSNRACLHLIPITKACSCLPMVPLLKSLFSQWFMMRLKLQATLLHVMTLLPS